MIFVKGFLLVGNESGCVVNLELVVVFLVSMEILFCIDVFIIFVVIGVGVLICFSVCWIVWVIVRDIVVDRVCMFIVIRFGGGVVVIDFVVFLVSFEVFGFLDCDWVVGVECFLGGII